MISVLTVLENDEQRRELAAFFKKNRDRFYAIAFSHLHDRAEAEDAVMEVFSIIADKPENFFSVQSSKRRAYADIITKRVSYKMIKKKQGKPIEFIGDMDGFASEISPEISIEDISLGNESARELLDFIRAMPEGKKDALLLQMFHGRSTAEIANILDISEEAARKRLSDAKKLIKDFIRDREAWS